MLARADRHGFHPDSRDRVLMWSLARSRVNIPSWIGEGLTSGRAGNDDCTRNDDRGADDGADHRSDHAGGDNKGDLRTRRGNDAQGFRFFKYCVKDYGISGRF